MYGFNVRTLYRMVLGYAGIAATVGTKTLAKREVYVQADAGSG
jgi:hypothetical protein